MPMTEDMSNRSSGGDDAAEPDTVIHRTYRGGNDATRAAALMDKTELLETASPAPPPLPQRDVLLAGRYELLVVLGRGATGIVYRGRDQLLGREVAIKLLYADLLNDH